MSTIDINETLKAIFKPFKGILAADERPISIKKRIISEGLDGTKKVVNEYRELLFSTAGLEKTVSGVILALDTFWEHKTEGFLTREYLAGKGIKVGVKVDGGLEQYKDTKYQLTKGIENLNDLCVEIKKSGGSFVKWRSVIPVGKIDDNYLLELSAQLSEYANISLKNGLVPIIEPEVSLKGTHTINESSQTLEKVLNSVINSLYIKNISPKNCILKTSFVTDGLDLKQTDPYEVGDKTLNVFKNVGMDLQNHFYGIVFLSGGLDSDTAIKYLQVIKGEAENTFFTPMTFSYGRALQQPTLREWNGIEENILKAQLVFTQVLQRAVKVEMGAEILPGAGNGKD